MIESKDLAQLRSLGIAETTVEEQIRLFKEGFPPMRLARAAVPGDGIIQLSGAEEKEAVNAFKRLSAHFQIMKFVPASGAASRMFKTLFEYMEANMGRQGQTLETDKKMASFFDGLKKFAFYNDLKAIITLKGNDLNQLLDQHKYAEILQYLLTEKGLNYGNLPKGLLAFHHSDGEIRMPIEEHMMEGAVFARDKNNVVRIHFTVSPEHESAFREILESKIPIYEKRNKCTYKITFSQQKKSTDTVAADEKNQPFRNSDGSLLFRPAGHGALLTNLNEVDADLIFLQNIDNVVPDAFKEKTTRNKMILGGVLLQARERIESVIKGLQSGELSVEEGREFLKFELYTELGNNASKEIILAKLNRPLRVCGMVVNTGAAGGGPFWCYNRDGSVSLQIVESSQFDSNSKEQMEIVKSSTHFNPVDVVAMKKDLKGGRFDLMNFVDPSTGFISSKSKDGKELKAMELPGLWNGSMSDWNTIFVEVPAVTFNPVKEVNDLLKTEHQ